MNRSLAQRYFPPPLVAVALVLVVLILLTPVLLSSGQPAPGSIQAEAELIVDHVVGGNTTHFYVRALGSTVRYAEIIVRVASGFMWTGTFPTGPLAWTRVVNATDVLAALYDTSSNPVALNVTVLYTVPGASAYYVGVLAFFIGLPTGSTAPLLYAVTTTPNVVPSPQEALAALPETIVLADVGSHP